METPKILLQYAEAITERGNKLAATGHRLLGLSVTLMTLLLPLSLLSLLSSATRIFLLAAVVFLIAATVCCLWLIIEDIRGATDKVAKIKDEAMRQMADKLPPRVVLGRPVFRRMYALLAIASISFGGAILSLSGALFQILLS